MLICMYLINHTCKMVRKLCIEHRSKRTTVTQTQNTKPIVAVGSMVMLNVSKHAPNTKLPNGRCLKTHTLVSDEDGFSMLSVY